MKTGELLVNMDSRYAYIYIVNGMIDHCVCGVVTGIKALFRVLSWNTVGWVFHEGKQAPIIYKRIGLNWVEFVNLYYEWQKRWTALYPYIPPPSLKLKVAPSAYHQKTKWSFMEVQVLAFVCEHKFVKSVVNHCPLVDVDVYDGLIQMRKAKILEIEKS